MRQWEPVLGTCLLKISEVNAHLPFPILLLDNDGVRQLVWVVNFPDKTYLDQLVYFIIDNLVAFNTKLMAWINVEPRNGNSGVDAQHSLCDHAKQSRLSSRNLINWVCSVSSSNEPTLTYLSGLSGSI